MTQANCFEFSGCDYFGPLYVQSEETGENANKAKKVWTALFTCLCTRAVHLELVSDLSTTCFLKALRRFVARRGVPREILSDNGGNFKKAARVMDTLWEKIIESSEVHTYLADHFVQWKFIPQLSPWMGGCFEKMVDVVKRNLKKALEPTLLSFEELMTVLCECEAVVNSRPLVFVGADLESGTYLSLAHFLSMNPQLGLPEVIDNPEETYQPKPNEGAELWKSWREGLKQVTRFWELWRRDYLMSLRERNKRIHKALGKAATIVPAVGDVVLVSVNKMPRGSWRLGRVTKLIKSRDGNIRTASVRLASGHYLTRDLRFLFPLECGSLQGDEGKVVEINQPRRPPSERKVAEVARKRLAELAREDMMCVF